MSTRSEGAVYPSSWKSNIGTNDMGGRQEGPSIENPVHDGRAVACTLYKEGWHQKSCGQRVASGGCWVEDEHRGAKVVTGRPVRSLVTKLVQQHAERDKLDSMVS